MRVLPMCAVSVAAARSFLDDLAAGSISAYLGHASPILQNGVRSGGASVWAKAVGVRAASSVHEWMEARAAWLQ